MEIKDRFYDLLKNFTRNNALMQELWDEINKQYNSSNRHYHNLNHIRELLEYFSEYEENIKNKDVFLFSVYYHDVIYKISQKDNEEKSALFAAIRLKKIEFPDEQIALCKTFIRASRKHQLLIKDEDLAYFLDFDLAVLGKSAREYAEYIRQIRKEYAVFPDFMYRKGRKKVLQSFLNKNRIYKTGAFYARFEQKARENIQNELISLS